MSSLTQDDFQFVTGFLYAEAGIALGGDKSYLVENRLEELCRSTGYSNVRELVAKVRGQRDPLASRQIVEAMTTNETSFFRDLVPFEGLRQTLLPGLLDRRRSTRQLRMWSAACSTGQEPYTLAMVLDSMQALLPGWEVSILATDLAEKVLIKAREGEFSQLEVGRGLSAQLISKHFRRSGNRYVVGESLKRLVRFEKVNLLNIPDGMGRFDLIFCRNVLIYFDVETKRRVLASLGRRLAPDGYLFLGASEVLHGVSDLYERVNVGGAVCYRLKHAA